MDSYFYNYLFIRIYFIHEFSYVSVFVLYEVMLNLSEYIQFHLTPRIKCGMKNGIHNLTLLILDSLK